MASVEDVKLHIESTYELYDDMSDGFYVMEMTQANSLPQLVMAYFVGSNLVIDAPFGTSEDLTSKQALALASTLIYGIATVGERYALRHVMALDHVSREDIDDGLTTLAACAASLKQ